MKSKKIFVLVSSLALLLAACNKPASTSQSQSGSQSANPTTSETSNPTSDSGQTEVAVTALAINKATLSLEAGKSESLSVTVTPENASNTKVTWETSDAKVATVSSLGKVTAVKVGTATITAKSVSNPTVTATCVVTVTEEGGKYGSVNKPKTVAEILAIAAQECKEANDKTADVVYVKGIVTKAPTTNSEKGYSRNIFLKDALTDQKDLMVYTANHDALKTPYQNDELVLHGYLMNYNGTIEISNVKINGTDVYPAIDAVTRGTSTITYNVEHGSVNADAPKSGKNNSEFQFKVTPEQGYKVDRVTIAGEAATPDDSGNYKGYIKGNTVVNIDISREGVEVKTAEMAYPGGPDDSYTKNMVEGNNAASVGLDATIFNVESTNSTGIYAGLNKSGEIRLYDNRKSTDPTQIANGTTLTISSRKVTITKIAVELTSSSQGDMEVKAGDQVVTGNEGVYQIENGQFSIQNVSRIIYDAQANTPGKQVVIKKVTISYTENAEVAATAIAVTPKTLTLKPEQTSVLSAALTPANATDTVSWKSSNEAKATVDASGIVTAVAEGNATITAYIDANKNGQVDDGELKDTAAVTVEAAEVINYGTKEAPLTIAQAKAVLDKTGTNESKQPLFVKGIISTNKAFHDTYHNGEVWLQSDDGSVAKDFEAYSCEIDSALNYPNNPAADELKGYEVVVTGYGKIYGTTYELTNVTRDNARVNPKIISMTRQEVPATAIAVAPTSAEVEVNKTVDLAATLTPANSTQKVAWKSSDEAKATVADGKVTGVAVGNVTITAFVDADKDGVLDENELKAECAVTVKAAAAKENLTETVALSFTNRTEDGVELKLDDSNKSKLGGDTILQFFQKAGEKGSHVTDVTKSSKVYSGSGTGGAFPGSKGLIKFGSSSAAGELTLELDGKANKVVINCQSFNDNNTVNKIAVNDCEAQDAPIAAAINTGSDLTFNLAEATDTIAIKTSSKFRVLVYTITISYVAE